MQVERTVLLVDDDKDDLELLEEALKIVDANHRIIEAQNGEEALGVLNNLVKEGKMPCLIVLDINMPKMDGRQTFLAIKADAKISNIPVVIFSTSSSMLDRTFFERHNTAYFIKPINFTQFARTASRMISLCDHRTNQEKKM